MKETDIRKYAELMKELELTGLEITEDKNKVRLERRMSAAATTIVDYGAAGLPASVVSASEQTGVGGQNASSSQTASVSQDYVSIKSPVVGVFYAAPAENADPYVSIGDSVKKGQILCVVEAMKLMNEIPADTDGVISEILVTNGQVVEYGTELFRIARKK